MSLYIHNLATNKQKAMLRQLEYIGRGEYDIENLSKVDASLLIDELLAEQRLMERDEDKYQWDY